MKMRRGMHELQQIGYRLKIHKSQENNCGREQHGRMKEKGV